MKVRNEPPKRKDAIPPEIMKKYKKAMDFSKRKKLNTAPSKAEKRNPQGPKDYSAPKQKHKDMLNSLIDKGYELACEMAEDKGDDSSEYLIVLDDRNPEKLAAISGFIEAMVKAGKSI